MKDIIAVEDVPALQASDENPAGDMVWPSGYGYSAKVVRLSRRSGPHAGGYPTKNTGISGMTNFSCLPTGCTLKLC